MAYTCILVGFSTKSLQHANNQYILWEPANHTERTRRLLLPTKCICSVQSRNLSNLKIELHILRIRKLCANREIAWAQFANMTDQWGVSELTNRKRVESLLRWWCLERGALHRSGVSLHPYPDWGEQSLSGLANFSEVSGTGGWSTCLILMVTTELQELLMYVPCLIHDGNSISRLCNGATQSWDCIIPLVCSLESISR